MKLEPCDYWKLRALEGDVQRNQQLLAIAQEKRQAFWNELTTKYDLRDNVGYNINDTDCSLTEIPQR